MSTQAAQESTHGDLLITNVGAVFDGSVGATAADISTVLIRDGRIAALGDDLGGDTAKDVPVLDAGGATVVPGLIDNHVHPVIGDWTPRQQQTNYLEGFVHGGVTRVVSAGEPHTPGRPRDRVGTKALAVLAHRSFQAVRPGGMTVHAGAVLLEPGLTKDDFVELADQGVHLVGEIGISGVQDTDQAAEMTRWAQAAGMTVTVHFGGQSVPGSTVIDGPFVASVRPDVAAHANGGPTAPSLDDVEQVLVQTEAAVEVVHNGNVRAARDIAKMMQRSNALDRLVVGTDSPAGTGVVPLGILRVLSWLCALGGLDAGSAIAAATGNTARVRRIDGGLLRVGEVGDIALLDAPIGSHAHDLVGALECGDTPAVAAVVIGGNPVLTRSRNTPPPKRAATVVEGR
ncbi:amidohydrolase family protein [Euzebya tangerina]|uniref:amidohydrolase family protein n=1 Tax=Euzebya tangerina TaxID=591198 RepID=UPI000E30E92C|nr:amidohydrolase family protein [Euzebya tangerina]